MSILLISPDPKLSDFIQKELGFEIPTKIILGQISSASKILSEYKCLMVAAGLPLSGKESIPTLIDVLIKAGSKIPLLALSSELGHRVPSGWRQAEYYDSVHNHDRPFLTTVINLWGTQYSQDKPKKTQPSHETRVMKEIVLAIRKFHLNTGAS